MLRARKLGDTPRIGSASLLPPPGSSMDKHLFCDKRGLAGNFPNNISHPNSSTPNSNLLVTNNGKFGSGSLSNSNASNDNGNRRRCRVRKRHTSPSTVFYACVCILMLCAWGYARLKIWQLQRESEALSRGTGAEEEGGKGSEEDARAKRVSRSRLGYGFEYGNSTTQTPGRLAPLPFNAYGASANGKLDTARTIRRKFPLIDRSVLEKLDRMQRFFEETQARIDEAARQSSGSSDSDSYYPNSKPELPFSLTPQIRTRPRPWPPLVTHIPERLPKLSLSPSYPAYPFSPHTNPQTALCASPLHPRPCRFLLPLRIAEQESKARIHFAQLVRLAKELDRTLVLPGVAKSKIGACFKWGFETYYDVEKMGVEFERLTKDEKVEIRSSQSDDTKNGRRKRKNGLFTHTDQSSEEPTQPEWFVGLDDFRAWLEPQHRAVTSQLVQVGTSLPAKPLSAGHFKNATLFRNDDVEVHGYEVYAPFKNDLPGCLSAKFPKIGLEVNPVFMSMTDQGREKEKEERKEKEVLVGHSIVEAFTSILGPTVREPDIPNPDVLVVNWDLRHPVFSIEQTGPAMEYSPRMYHLANKYAPGTGLAGTAAPYLAVQWRMETVDPTVLEDCARSLVDLLGRLLNDKTLAGGIQTVWFASDYPFPISRRAQESTTTPPKVAKSGTFRDFEERHEAAAGILRTAFEGGGGLDRWKLTDITEATVAHGKDVELMQDSGVLGILDKLISTRAALFVSGSSICSRKSSFTKQVIDARQARRTELNVANIVDTFG